MSLAVTARKAMQSGFKSFGTLRTSITYHSVTDNPFSTSTLDATTTETNYALTNIIVTPSDRLRDDNDPTRQDAKTVIIPGQEIEGKFTPKIRDGVTVSGVRYEVIRVDETPGNIAWSLGVQAP